MSLIAREIIPIRIRVIRRARLHLGFGRVMALLLTSAVMGTGCAQSQSRAKPPFAAVAKKLVAAINADDAKAVEKLFSPAMRRFMPADRAAQFFRTTVVQKGKIEKIGRPEVDDGTAYFRLNAPRGALDLQLTLDDDNLVSGLWLRRAGPNLPLPSGTAKAMRLPFSQEWTVGWGGSTKAQNYHIVSPAQRRAIDVVVEDADGSSYRGTGESNADYYAYGKAILAAASGTVIEASDGIPENVPGAMNEKQVFGNHVIVQQAPHEFAVYAHLQPGSIRVKKGESIKAGQILGKCGNSGHSSEPHLHFHVQNSPDLEDGSGITPRFQNVRLIRNGKADLAQDYTPLRGDRIRPNR